MNYASLFSGVGGFETALNNEGFTCVFASEIDKHANTAYEVLYNHKTAGDITKVDASTIPDHDILTAGFPCQAFSVAGNRKGFEDTRGTLFFEVARVAAEKKPRFLLLENVKGLISHDKGTTLDTIVTTLNSIGYTVDFEVLNSKYFGVPQNRERIFIVGVLDGATEEWDVGKRKDVVAKGKRRISKIGEIKTFNFEWPKNIALVSRLRDVLEDNVDEKYYLSEEKTRKLVGQLRDRENHIKEIKHGDVMAVVSPEITKKNQNGQRIKPNDEPMFALTIRDRHGVVLAEPVIEVVGMLDMKGNDAVRRVDAPTGISPTLTTMGGGHREPKIVEIRPVLTPDRETKRQQGRRFKEDGEPAFTLNTINRHGVAVGKFPKYRIRKLTPLECFRLQGFSDESFYKLKYYSIEEAKELLEKQKGKHGKRAIPHETRIERISDSQLYKMAGNAVTVNVITAIAKQLKKVFKWTQNPTV
jgi:DNA (cytosine-5)-methyltransferase 1